MKIFGLRMVSGLSLDTIIKEYNQKHYNQISRKDFYHLFFTKNEKKLINTVYMTVYENKHGKKYVNFTNHLPMPGGVSYDNIDSLIGATTGYNTKIISCEKCYIIG